MSDLIKAKWDVEVDIGATIDLGIRLTLISPSGVELPAFLSPAQARDAAKRLITTAEEVDKRDV